MLPMKTLNSRFVLLTISRSPSSSSRSLAPCSSHSPSSSSSSSSSSCSFRQSRLRRSVRASSSRVFSSPLVRRPADRFGNGSSPPLQAPSTFQPSDSSAASDLALFLELMPDRMRREVTRHPELGDLIEVVMDLGRKPLARFPTGDWAISEQPVKLEDLRHAISKVGDFSDDNRSGINSSLHRISAIRNRKMQIIGLTCRVGRAIAGSAEMIRDLVESGGSILVIGPPGVGKTTLIREIARMLADDHKKRVVIIDTSNEIGGDGDVPHSGIGRARRMQVPNVNMQHNVMIEAVENHMPETIVIDEIGTELEALAAGTIAQRGVQLVGTAHGMTIESIIKNPSLQSLVGGVESVTLGDDEAKRRKVQKTILERRGPPTFTCAVEMISRVECRVHHNLEATVDAILAGKPPLFEVRHMDGMLGEHAQSRLVPEKYLTEVSGTSINNVEEKIPEAGIDASTGLVSKPVGRSSSYQSMPVRLYTYKILEADLLQVAEVMGIENDIEITDDIGSADAILALNSEIKQNPWIRGVAKFHQLPIFVIKKNTMAQMVKAIRMILGMDNFGAAQNRPVDPVYGSIEVEDDAPARKPSLEEIDALEEVRLAIEYIVIPGGEPVELLPRCSQIIARQLELVESYQLTAERSGTELNSRLQILPQRIKNTKSSSSAKLPASSRDSMLGFDTLTSNGGGTSVTRLPLLPE
ncbi:protein SEEDLING PLASTID DEVELOPMENT 1 [Nymphaea colorata]|nr:protein SEEDLING PLASTID DEVELOPMENT 1 [Nymphaea colorata]